MSIASISQYALLPERELILGKRFTLQENPALIASVTEQCGIIKMWLFQQMPETPAVETEYEMAKTHTTNRDDIVRRTAQVRVGYEHISEIEIQGIKLAFSRSSSGIIEGDHIAHMKLQHFIEKGVDFSSIKDVNFHELVLAEYQLADGEKFPEIDTGTDMPILLCTQEKLVETIIKPSHLFKFDIGEQTAVRRSFIDMSDGTEIVYYINRVVRYDIWKETEARLYDEATIKMWREHGLDDEGIARMRVQFHESLSRVCPKGHEMLIIQYETPDNIQLNFYTSEFLESEPEINSSSVGFIGISEKADGVHGFPVRTGILQNVPPGFDGPVEAELISWCKRIPGERIEA